MIIRAPETLFSIREKGDIKEHICPLRDTSVVVLPISWLWLSCSTKLGNLRRRGETLVALTIPGLPGTNTKSGLTDTEAYCCKP
jgi:hypothetical protein